MTPPRTAAPLPAAYAAPDVGRALQDAEKVLPDGWELVLTRREPGRWLATVHNGSGRRWTTGDDPVEALNALVDLLVKEAGMAL